MNRRKGTPCACECDPCKGKNSIRAINNVSPDPNGDFNVNAGSGIIISGDENGIIIANGMPDPASLVAGDNIDITPSGDDIVISVSNDINIPGDAVIGGDLTVNGTYYTVHAEHVYTEDDYIIMRDGAVAGLGAGDFSGFQVKKYDGVNDGRLVIDNSGTARVGDVGDEQPLMTREESANLNDGALLKWDAANFKAVNVGSVGTNTRPIRLNNGVPVAVDEVTNGTFPLDSTVFGPGKYGEYKVKNGICYVIIWGVTPLTTTSLTEIGKTDLPVPLGSTFQAINIYSIPNNGTLYIDINGGQARLRMSQTNTSTVYATISYPIA